MESLFGAFALISMIYVVIGIVYLYRVITHWRELWDDHISADDIRLATSAAFFLLIPPTVMLHELGHAVAVAAFGQNFPTIHFLGYIGWVNFAPMGGIKDFTVALAGNLVTLAVGIGTIVYSLARPGHPIRNVLLIELGRQSLFLVLLFYPLICIWFPGDFQMIYNFDATPIASSITAGAHGLLLALGYGVLWKRRWRPRTELLKSPLALKLIELEKRVRTDDDDHHAHRELGLILASSDQPARARRHLEIAVAAGIIDARTHLAYGTVLFQLGEYERAIPELEASLNGLLRPEDRLLAEAPLKTARAMVAKRGPS